MTDRDGSPVLELIDVAKHYGSLRAVDGVSLRVEAGERRAVIGPNGAGKSTLFSAIAGETRVTRGRLFFRGEEITGRSEDARARLGIGRTFQHSRLFDGLSVHENVAMAVQRAQGVARRIVRPAPSYRAVEDAVDRLLEDAQLADRHTTPAGALSHGERRQLEIAMALANAPTLLLLDEPSAGMSPAERSAFVEAIRRLPADLTLLVVEHDMDVVLALASRITVLTAGSALAEGTPEQIAGSAEVQEAYLGTAEELPA